LKIEGKKEVGRTQLKKKNHFILQDGLEKKERRRRKRGEKRLREKGESPPGRNWGQGTVGTEEAVEKEHKKKGRGQGGGATLNYEKIRLKSQARVS